MARVRRFAQVSIGRLCRFAPRADNASRTWRSVTSAAKSAWWATGPFQTTHGSRHDPAFVEGLRMDGCGELHLVRPAENGLARLLLSVTGEGPEKHPACHRADPARRMHTSAEQ